MKDGKLREGLVCYSLGNFISNQRKNNTDGGILFEAVFEKNTFSNITKFKKHQPIPIWRYIERKNDRIHQFYTLPIAEFQKEDSFLSEDDRTEMLEYLEGLKEVLED